MFSDTWNKTIYGLRVEISMVFKILETSGVEGIIPYGPDQSTTKCSMTEGTRI
jgi:hypothetical protein